MLSTFGQLEKSSKLHADPVDPFSAKVQPHFYAFLHGGWSSCSLSVVVLCDVLVFVLIDRALQKSSRGQPNFSSHPMADAVCLCCLLADIAGV